ncbi:storkhead-box protein 1 isoform X1 [Pipistrellus kuhlii]|uniref:Storkhead box 1 n=1 Tax=Pipistrellus kuhlii TaxID=59472 RepID=A0A7J7VD90_PIPKU|nr:storkhead-box protein 1 isoform X1 [Pipistrellus kuhlii]KAF6322916.1 storkhead box 1 [Pipistrellus kuhlii]
MARPVQLAPESLALVLSRLEAPAAAAGGAEEPGGHAVFRAFRRANARCFWDARLARAASRLAFQGWLRRAVLLVRAPAACLQVLRAAWARRALRPPRGFRIRALGDVFPVQMNPIAQAQFVPLAEVLCCAISDMNAAEIVVTQESLLEHLMKHYPGIAIPSQDILYTALGTLIKERKIYHTGEGYFIVTPQTYFITNTNPQEHKRARSDESREIPAFLTYLVSVESCAELAELARENTAPVSHCPSCQCFPDGCTQDPQEPPAAAELTRKGQKGLGESRPLVQNRAVSASEENPVPESTKPLPYTRGRDKGKKFGFSLFWRSMSRKEKSRRGHSSFSAQFPPEEWPVRDEDNLDNIPRDVEHEIIKRINPVLTVDNLIKHTILMQKYEEQKKYNSQGTSTDMLTVGHKYLSREGAKKRQGRSAKPGRRGHSHRDRHKARSQGSEPPPGSTGPEKHPKLPATQPTPRRKSPHEAVVQKPLGETPSERGSHLIYKKRINNPFQGLSHRRSPITKGRSHQKTSDLKSSQSRPKGKPFQRSRSLDSSRIPDGEAKQPRPEQGNDKLRAEPTHMSNSTVKPVSDDFRDHLLHYSQCSVLQKDSRRCSFRESRLTCDVYGRENKVTPEDLRERYSLSNMLGETTDTRNVLPSPGPSSLDQASFARRLVDNTTHQFQNLCLLDYPLGVDHLRQPERQDRDSEETRRRKAFVQEAETVSLENEVLSDDAQALYQNKGEDEDGACSSLYLDEDDFSENDDLCQMLPGHIEYSFSGKSQWSPLGKQKVTERSLTEYHSKMQRFEPPALKGSECCKPALLTNPGVSQKPNLSAESCGLNSGTPSGSNYEEDPSVAECVQASTSAERSIFDYYSSRKASAEAETPQDCVDTGKKAACWSQSAQNQEMRKQFTQKLELLNTTHMPVMAQDIQHEHRHLEGTENQSMAGDSGIDSPRTQSLASNNSVILDGLKRRQNFLQNFEGTKSSQTLTSNPLLQLTPVINV